MPRISVIVAARDVAEFLRDCLFSIITQEFSDIEVIVADDGSVDSTPAIIRAFEKLDSRVSSIRTSGLGPGAARNRALDKAQGNFIGFVDGDDIIDRRYFLRLYAAASARGAELAVTTAERLMPDRQRRPVRLLQKARISARRDQSIRENHALVWDTVMWNKLIEAKFLREQVGRFPEGRVYEDMILSYRAHILATNVATVSEGGYAWRLRAQKTSITQSRSDAQNFTDRIAAVTELWDFVESNAPNLLYPFQKKQITWDIPIYIEGLISATPEYQNAARDLLPPIIRRIRRRYLRRLLPADAAIYRMLAKGDVQGAAAVVPQIWRPRLQPRVRTEVSCDGNED